jgi:hypothetical protein
MSPEILLEYVQITEMQNTAPGKTCCTHKQNTVGAGLIASQYH